MTIKAVGIDLGTTFSVVGIFKNGKVDIIANNHGNRITRSLVTFNGERRLIGDTAYEQINADPVNSITNVKRLMGQKYNNPSVQKDIKEWPYKTICENGNTPMIQVEYQGEQLVFAPEQISAMILSDIKETVETYLGYTVENAVITVPAYFNDSQRQATKDAGVIAGFNVIGILNEPTAAAIAYGFDKRDEGKKNILVYDLGGGTFDVTILTMDNGVFEVKATSGDVHLGGEDFDNQLVEYFAKDIEISHRFDVRKDPRALRRLRTACEKAKRRLSFATSATVVLESLGPSKKDYKKDINQDRFEKLCGEMFRRTLEPVQDALRQSKMGKHEIDDVVLVGGSTTIPKIKSLLSDFFDGKRLSQSINPDEAVANGATIYAAMLSGDKSEVIRELRLSDVTPLSLGVETRGKVMNTLIQRNTTIPTKHTMEFTTTEDEQPSVWITVCEGEQADSKENNFLGKFFLTGIQIAPQGVPRIDVTLGINIDGILEVTAVDRVNGSQGGIRIDQMKGRLSKEQIRRMIEEEDRFRARELRKVETANARDRLGNLLFDMRAEIEDKKKMSKLNPTQKTVIMNRHEITDKWYQRNGDSATKEDLDDQYEQYRAACLDFASAIGERLIFL